MLNAQRVTIKNYMYLCNTKHRKQSLKIELNFKFNL